MMITRLIGALMASPTAWVDVDTIFNEHTRRGYFRDDTPAAAHERVLWECACECLRTSQHLTTPLLFAQVAGRDKSGELLQVLPEALISIERWRDLCKSGDAEVNAVDVAHQLANVVTARAVRGIVQDLADARTVDAQAIVDVVGIAGKVADYVASAGSLPASKMRQAARKAWRAKVEERFDPSKPTRIAVPTGLPALDGYMRGGFGIGEETIIAAGTSVGKSLISGMVALACFAPESYKWESRLNPAFMLKMRMNVPRDHAGDVRVLVIGLEDPAEAYLDRWMLNMLNVKTEDLDVPGRREEVFRQHGELAGIMRERLLADDCPIEVVDSDTIGGDRGNGQQLGPIVDYMREWVRVKRIEEAELGKPLRLCIVLDYLQLIELAPEITSKIPQRYQQLAAINKRLVRFAKAERVAMVATAMLNGAIGVPADQQEIREAKDIEHGAHSIIKIDVLSKTAAARIREAEPNERGELATQTMAFLGTKGRTTGAGWKAYGMVRYEYGRICGMPDARMDVMCNAMEGDALKWARERVAPPTDVAPKRRRKKVTGSDEIES